MPGKPLPALPVVIVQLLVGDLLTRVIRPVRLDEPRRLGRFGRLVDEALDVRRHLGAVGCPALSPPLRRQSGERGQLSTP